MDGQRFTELAIATQDINYTPEEKAVRDAFVEQYIVDQNPIDAAMRVGFTRAFAEKYARQFLDESYVIKRIRKREDENSLQNEEFIKAQHSRVLSNLIREANYFGPGGSSAARIAANIKIAELTGLTDVNGNSMSSGVMVVESMSDPDSWEEKAAESQAKLKEEVKQ